MSNRDTILKEFARKLNGGEYDDFPTKDQCNEAKEKRIVIIYGASDDLCEIEGAISDEVGFFKGGSALINSKGFVEVDCDREYCPYFQRYLKETGTELKIIWNDFDYPSWRYETEIPHEKFNIYEYGEVFCEGIVFYADDLKRE